jgi:IS5 family transposase
MLRERTVQATIFEVFAQHEIGCELKAMSQRLDGQLALVSLVAGDLRRRGVRETGRRGLPVDSVLRCALLKQQRQLSYEELAFHLEDSASFRASARSSRCGATADLPLMGLCRANLAAAKVRGAADVAFHKKAGIAVADMVKSPWVYRRLCNFRAGISSLKRAYGAARCTWRGLDHFKAYIWSAVFAHDLVLFARLKLA